MGISSGIARMQMPGSRHVMGVILIGWGWWNQPGLVAAQCWVRQAAREAACKAGSIVRREGAREGACKSGSMVVRQATSPTPSNNSFCSQPAIPIDIWHAQQAQA